MWAFRVLSGKHTGQFFHLVEGKNRIGRGERAGLRIDEPGVSKEHLEITVMGEKVLFTDLQSANGTYLNGTRVKGGVLQLGDKFGLGNVICDLVRVQQNAMAVIPSNNFHPQVMPPAEPPTSVRALSIPQPPAYAMEPLQNGVPAPMGSWDAPVPYSNNAGGGPPSPPPTAHVPQTAGTKFDNYIQSNLLPPLFHATEQFEFRSVLLGILGVYVIAITMLAVIPMKQITSDSIATESRRRAITVVRSLAKGNEKVLRSGDVANFSTDFALKEEGIDDAYVTSKDGHILAPAERVGSFPKEAGFFRDVILKANNREVASELDGKVIAAVPIMGYDPDLQQNVARAYAVVIYNPGSLTFDDGRVFSLFVQTLVLALLVGAVMYFLLYRIIQYPFQQLNLQLDEALRENKDHADVKVQLPVMRDLLTNINSLLNRAFKPTASGTGDAAAGARNHEYMNLMNMIGYPGVLLDSSGVILRCNANFEALLGTSSAQLINHKYDVLPDQALQKNIEALMQASVSQTAHIAADRLEIAGHMFILQCQAMTTATGEVDCFFLTISPAEGAADNAA